MNTFGISDRPPLSGSIHRVLARNPERLPPLARASLVFVPEPAAVRDGLVTCLKASNETDMAAAGDLVAHRADSGLAYDLLVMPDLFGYVRAVDLEPALTPVFSTARAFALPAIRRTDARWRWKSAEHTRMKALEPSLAEILGEVPLSP